MQKLNKRQIIILCVAFLFMLYAAYELAIVRAAAKKAKTDMNPTRVSDFISTVNAELAGSQAAAVDEYIARRAETKWDASPFWDRVSYREWAGGTAGSHQAGSAVKIIYSGFVDAGGKQMAVINGWEYTAGEALEMEGYILKRITPFRVIIENRNTGSELAVPIQE